MTQEQHEFWRDAWFPVGLCVLGFSGLIVKGLLVAVPYLITAIAAALD
jgi:hypothetical protein